MLDVEVMKNCEYVLSVLCLLINVWGIIGCHMAVAVLYIATFKLKKLWLHTSNHVA